MYAHLPKVTLLIVRYGLIPAMFMTCANALCSCSCRINSSKLCFGNREVFNQPQECYVSTLNSSVVEDRYLTGSGGDAGVSSGTSEATQASEISEYPEYPMVGLCPAYVLYTIWITAFVVLFLFFHGKHHLLGGFTLLTLIFLSKAVTEFSFQATYNYPMLNNTESAASSWSERDIQFLTSFGMLAAAVVFASLAVWIWTSRKKALATAEALIAPVRKQYDEVWDHYRTTDQEGLQKLDQAWENARIKHSKTEQPVNKLSSLFEQAAAVNPWYQKKVGLWHETSGLKSATGSTHSYEPATIKNPDRVIEKARRSYVGIVSKVCDIVRASIIVKSFDEARTLLEAIESDKDVNIVRGKNRFLSTSSALDSGGYRDIQLSLQLIGYADDQNEQQVDISNRDAAFVSACKRHVAEMQIHLSDIHDLKTKDMGLEHEEEVLQTGHGRYSRFRVLVGF